MSKTFTVEITVPEGLKAGDVFTAEVEMPAAEKKARGQLAGLSLEEMTDEQLKRELINANSVLYKAQQRGASAETIAANQARVDAAKAEKAKRAPVVVQATATPNVAAVMDGETPDAPVDTETAEEI